MTEDQLRVYLDVSIHAPVKGATFYSAKTGRSYKVSIHAPVKGATPSSFWAISSPEVSIHAPVKGATAGMDAWGA